MQASIFIVLLVAAVATAAPRAKRQAYVLPDGVELLIGSVKTSFQCQNSGYYADVDNNCQVFHICNLVAHADGKTELQQFSFVCGNQTVFNQLSFTCAFPDEAVPCQNAADFFYLNAKLGDPTAFFLTDDDIQRAVPLITGATGRVPAPAPQPARPGRPGGGRFGPFA
ncbi:U-scoloptoxin(01)-Er1a-like [Ornithodoros turicata]|uniref:U-scoloptoxin(01)-Er1a-like n=1 Tax=Ornithodoros turicata TaxID=34597 RepID=UPI003139FD52